MSELMNEEALQEQEYLTEAERKFTVGSDLEAQWCLDRIREATAEKERWKTFYDEQYSKVEKACDFKIAYMERLLRPYFDQVPHKVAKTQESYPLPNGKLVIKRQGPEYERDDEQLLPWLHQNNLEGFIRVKESVDWAGLKKTLTDLQVVGNSGQLITQDGEVIPGITVTERPDKFVVEVK